MKPHGLGADEAYKAPWSWDLRARACGQYETLRALASHCGGVRIILHHHHLDLLRRLLSVSYRASDKLTVQSLKTDLNEYLAAGHIDPLTKPPTAVLKPTSRQIELNGRWVSELKGWLEMKGF